MHSTNVASARPTRYGAGVFAALAIAGSLAACGSSSKSAATPASSTAAAPTSSVAAPPANTLTVTASDYNFKVVGSPRPGRIDITYTNDGQASHMFAVAKLKPGATAKALVAASQGPESDAAAAALVDGDPNSQPGFGYPALIGPGKKTEVITTDKLTAGTYALLCFVPGPDGMPHAFMGMYTQFTVAGTSDIDTPKTDGTISLTDTGITVPPGFTGKGTYEVSNTGTKQHDFTIALLKSGTLDAFYTCVNTAFGNNKPLETCPSGVLSGGDDLLDPGNTSYLKLDLPAGNYGYVSDGGENGADYKAGLKGTFTVS